MKTPALLITLAVVNILVFTLTHLHGLYNVVGILQETPFNTLDEVVKYNVVRGTSLIILTIFLSLLSAIGFIKQNKILGFIIGNLFCVFLLYLSIDGLIKSEVISVINICLAIYTVILILSINIIHRKRFN